MDTIKLQKYLAQAGISSRRKAEQYIAEGSVTVNGQVAHLGQRISPTQDKVSFEGKPLNLSTDAPVYLAVHKPPGYVTTASDELGRKTILDLIPKSFTQRLFPVGRLDLDSEGLVLLTNDGELAYQLTHPKFEVSKTYKVLLKGIPSTPALEYLKRGVKISNKFVKPVKFSILSHENKTTWMEITIKEGVNHQVKRMFEKIGYDVLRLIRTEFGPLQLENLKQKQTRILTDDEVQLLKSAIKHFELS